MVQFICKCGFSTESKPNFFAHLDWHAREKRKRINAEIAPLEEGCSYLVQNGKFIKVK